MSALVAGPLETRVYRVTRADLAAYAEASGDRNPIHLDEAVATSVGLPGVIAHGMYTLALAARAVADWSGGAEVVSLGAKFTAPVVVPAGDDGVEVVVSGTVTDVSDATATLALEVSCDGQRVLGRPRAVVRG